MKTKEQVTGVEQPSSKRYKVTFIVSNVLIVGLLVVLGWQLLTPRANPTPSENTGSSRGSVWSPMVGKPAPNFALSVLTSEGKTISLSDYKGKPVILNFWSTTCEPCVRETPFLQHSWETTLKPKGVALIGIDGGDINERAINFLQKYGVTYTSLVDTFDGSTAISYGATLKPETYFINKDGVIVSRWVGELDEKGLQSELAKLNL